MMVSNSGYSFGLRDRLSAIVKARRTSLVTTALHNSKLLNSFEMPMYVSISAFVIRRLPSGSDTSSLESSFEILEMSVPIWFTSNSMLAGSISNPFERTNPPSHSFIS